MNKVFKKASEIKLINGGYVVDSEENPIFNLEFVEAQKEAHRVVVFAEVAKGKDLKGKKADTIEEIEREVDEKLKEKAVSYLENPKEKTRKITESLKKEALEFIDYQNQKSKVEKTNEFMQKFNAINEFETFGLFFEPGIVKLEKIYTIEELKKASQEIADLVK